MERLTRHLNKGIPLAAMNAYLATVRKWTPSDPVIHIDDSDVVKPDGHKFEALGLVWPGSKSTDTKNVYEKGYHVTETCVLTNSSHPVSIFSRIHSSREKNFTSVNDITFAAMERGAALFGKATFVMDRGYDDNKMFAKLDKLGQDYVIRLTDKRKLYFYEKWGLTAQLHNQRKGKIRTPLVYKGKSHDACHQSGDPVKGRCHPGAKSCFHQRTEFLYHFVHSISGPYLQEAGNKLQLSARTERQKSRLQYPLKTIQRF